MSDQPAIPRSELAAVVEARKELGPEYEQAIVDSLADRLEREVEGRVTERSKLEHKAPPIAFVPQAIGGVIGALAVAGIFTGLAGVIVVCVAIVLVSLVFLRR